MVHLLLGEDPQAKDKKINDIKAAILKQPEALFFDFESFDGHFLSAATLKKSLLAIPVFSSQRVILVRHIHKLKIDPSAILVSYVQAPSNNCELVLEASGELKGALKEIIPLVKTQVFGIKKELNIFDMTKLMSTKKTTEALKIMHEFYEQGTYPLQMMGALVWYWGKEGRALGVQKFEKGLKALEQADLNIKRSRLLPEYALEKLVVELVELQR